MIFSRNCLLAFYIPLCLSIGLLGCGGVSDAPATIPASGTVTYNGAPVKNATITFSPSDSSNSRSAMASSDENGNFQTPDGKGLMVGKYKVVIQAYKKPLADIPPKDLATEGGDNNLAVPKKYMELSTTDLEVEVTSSDSSKEITFDLKD